MQVNTDIWGNPEQWQSINATYDRADVKKPASGSTSYYAVYNSNKLQVGEYPTDISLAFWGIGKGSIMCHPMYLASYWDSTLKTTALPVYNDVKEIPAIFNYANDPTGTPDASWAQRYAPNPDDEAQISVPALGTDAPFARTLVSDFNYQKILIEPYVRIGYTTATSSTWGFTTVSLKTYIDNKSTTYSSYGKIVAIGYKVAIGDGIDDNRSTGNNELGHVYPVSYEGSDKKYQYSSGYTQYSWFSTTYGIHTLECSYTWGGAQYLTPWRDYPSVNMTSYHSVGDADTGLRYKYCVNYYSGGKVYGQVPIYYYNPEDEIWKLNDIWNSNYSSWAHPFPYIEVTNDNLDDVKNYVLKQIAYLGLPFVYDPAKLARGQIGEVGVFLPVFDSKGITTGEYKEGTEALSLPNARWIDGREGAGYDPSVIPENEDFGDLTNQTPGRIINAGGLEMFVMTYAEVESFERFITGTYSPTDLDLIADFKGTNPQDYIVSVQKYPFDLPPKGITGEPIYIGKIDTEKTALAFDDLDQSNCYLDFGTISFLTDVVPYYDYRDYDTKIVLLLPFIGSVELDPRLYFGHNLGLIYNIDYYTGHVTAEIKRDGLTVDTKTNTISLTIPFFAGNMGQYQSALAQTQLAIEQTKIKQITGAVTTVASIGGAAASISGGSTLGGLGSAGGIVKGASNMLLERINQESLEYTLTHTQPSVGNISTAAPGNAFLMDDRARVLVWRPYMLDAYNSPSVDTRLSGAQLYAATVGNACAIPGYLSDFSGFTVAASAELAQIYTIDGTKAATEQEIQMIRRALLAGVYV